MHAAIITPTDAIWKVRAEVRALRTDEGGRRSLIPADYRAMVTFEPWQQERLNDGRLRLVGAAACPPGEASVAEVAFLCPECLPATVRVWAPFFVQEGRLLVARSVVLAVLERGPAQGR